MESGRAGRTRIGPELSVQSGTRCEATTGDQPLIPDGPKPLRFGPGLAAESHSGVHGKLTPRVIARGQKYGCMLRDDCLTSLVKPYRVMASRTTSVNHDGLVGETYTGDKATIRSFVGQLVGAV